MSRAAFAQPLPQVEPVADGQRPLWSVMIPTYNCAHQVEATLASVLAQAPAPECMEIVLVDDASRDDIAAVAARHKARVRLHRQPKNLGVPANLIEAVRLSRGRLIHLLHGDDLVEPGFYRAMEAAFVDADAGAAYCRHAFIDVDGQHIGLSPLELEAMGRIPDALRFLASEQRIMTPSICVRREVYEHLGAFHPALRCAEDWEMWVRIARYYPIVYVPEVLARYRMQADSNTGRNVGTGGDVQFNRLAIDIMRAYLPADMADEVAGRAMGTYAQSAFEAARNLAERGDIPAAISQWRAALRLSRNPKTLITAVLTMLRIGRASLRHGSAA